MNRIDLGTRLRSLRTERGLSLSQLEAATSISSSFLSLVESGKSDITISRLVRLADFFDVELNDLVEGSRVDRRPLEVIRDGDGSVLASRAEGVTARFLGHQRWQLSPRVSEFEPGGVFDVAGHGADPVEVSRGDAALVRDGADRVANVGRRPGRLLVVGVATCG